MGITVRSKNYSIDLGYTGFLRLRTKVAELTAPDIFLHYRRLLDGRSLLLEADRKKFYEEYNRLYWRGTLPSTYNVINYCKNKRKLGECKIFCVNLLD